MKNMLLVFLLIVLVHGSVYPVTMNIVYPREGDILSAAAKDSAFIFGQVQPSNCHLIINGEPIKVFSNGAFLAYLPVKSGDFFFNCMAFNEKDTVRTGRLVYITPLLHSVSKDTLKIEAGTERPSSGYKLTAGDLFRVSFMGTPGCRAGFTIDGVAENIPMAEVPPNRDFYWGETVFGDALPPSGEEIEGLYRGSYQIQPGDSCDSARITFQLVNDAGDTVLSTARGTLDIIDPGIPVMAETIADETVLRTARNCGYYYFLPKGVKLRITGQKGEYLRVRLSDTEEAWVQSWNVRTLPPGTVPPQVIVNVVRTQNMGGATRVRVFTGERIPFRIVQDVRSQTLTVLFYGVISDTDWIRHDFTDPLIRDIRWTQTAPEVYELKIELNQQHQWGYNASFDAYDHFVFDIKKAPRISGWPSSPLKNIFVLLDPGHSPDLGAVGPTGYAEKDANLKLANVLGKKLKDKGAIVFYTRTGAEGISLRARKKMAEIVNPDFLLSLHHNAIPDGLNPFRNHGTSTYYYQPQSYDLARLVQENLLKKLKLVDFGLYYDNLAMCRPTQMPAILIEPAFMMYPEEEMLVKTKKYMNKCSDAIVDALEEYLKTTSK